MRMLKAFGPILIALTVLTAQQTAPLTNADVIKMVKSGRADPAIVSAISASETQFDLSSTGLSTLNQAGVSSKVIRAMLAAESKKKDAAEKAENSAPAPDSSTTSSSASDASSGAGPQGMNPQGMPGEMSADQMTQMMNSLPPEMRARLQASMAARNTSRAAKAGSGRSANSIPSLAGVPV